MKDKIILATVVSGMVILVIAIFFIGVHHGSRVKAMDMVEVFEAGKKEALRVSPRPSLELEITCANVWAGKVAPPEVLK
jgi:hypothetical protein